MLDRKIVSEYDRGAAYYKGVQPHPYLGFISTEKINHSPLWNDETQEPKIEKHKDDFNIGVFGASTASDLYDFFLKEPGKTLLQSAIDKKFGVGKKIRLIEYANGAWYQPQTLIATILYARNLDLAISLEGANELQRTPAVNFPAEFPRNRLTQMYFGNDLETHTNLVLVDLATQFSQKLEAAAERGVFPSFLKTMSIVSKNLVRSKIVEPVAAAGNGQELGRLWIDSVETQQTFLRSQHITHLLFLQPMPCLQSPFVEPTSPYCGVYNREVTEITNEGLNVFRAQAVQRGVRYIDLTKFFPEPDPKVFIDEAHFTPEGYELLARKVLLELDKAKIESK